LAFGNQFSGSVFFFPCDALILVSDNVCGEPAEWLAHETREGARVIAQARLIADRFGLASPCHARGPVLADAVVPAGSAAGDHRLDTRCPDTGRLDAKHFDAKRFDIQCLCNESLRKL
jgi:hypothetical protein